MSTIYDVAIVGYGPVGATLVNVLGQFGLRTIAFDKEVGIYNLPRAVHFDDETMRIFQFAGVADALREVVRVNPGMKFVDDDGNLLLDWPRPEGITEQGWNSSFRFHQPDLERILRNQASHLPNADLFLEHEVIDIQQDKSKVDLTVMKLGDGEQMNIQAKFIVGCDGARSFVRKHMGSSLEDLGFHERWLVTDILLKHPRPDLGDYSIQYCSKSQPATYVRCPQNRRRWEMALQDDCLDFDPADESAVWRKLKRWITPEDGALERSAVYEFRSAVAKTWRNGRMFLAGDAAHQMPPFMGQGMCAGIRDAINLGWKLAISCKNDFSEELLDSYEQERSPHVRTYIEMAVKLGKLINTSDTKGALKAAFPQADGTTRLKSPALRLEAGPGVLPDQWGGFLSPQLMLDGSNHGDNVIGGAACLLVRRRTDELVSKFSSFSGKIVSPEDNSSVGAYLDKLAAQALLIRPDRYLFGGAEAVDHVPDLLDSWHRFLAG